MIASRFTLRRYGLALPTTSRSLVSLRLRPTLPMLFPTRSKSLPLRTLLFYSPIH